MLKKKINHRAMALRVCVDRVQNGQISGRVYSPCLDCGEEGLAFTDIANFFLQIEAVFDCLDFPRAFERKRSFVEAEQPSLAFVLQREAMDGPKEDSLKKQGAVFTFMVYVTTRQNTTWQGFVDWLEGEPTQSFQSALELIRLVDRALSQGALAKK